MRKSAPPEQAATAAPAKPLSASHQRFVAEYAKDRNATKAYQRAYPHSSPAAAGTAGSRLLKDVRIKAAIEQAHTDVLEQVKAETGISLERTLRELARVGYFDPRKMFDAKGQPKALHELDEDTAAVVAGLEVLEEWEGSGEDRVLVGHVKKWKLADKLSALDKLMKHLGGYKEDNNQAAGGLADLLSQVQRSALPIAATVPDDGDDA